MFFWGNCPLNRSSFYVVACELGLVRPRTPRTAVDAMSRLWLVPICIVHCTASYSSQPLNMARPYQLAVRPPKFDPLPSAALYEVIRWHIDFVRHMQLELIHSMEPEPIQ